MTGEYQCAGLADLLVIADDSNHWHRAVRVSGKISLFMTMTNQLLEAVGISQSQATNSPAPGNSAMGNFQTQLILQFAADIMNEIRFRELDFLCCVLRDICNLKWLCRAQPPLDQKSFSMLCHVMVLRPTLERKN